jgi:hypothetical protein
MEVLARRVFSARRVIGAVAGSGFPPTPCVVVTELGAWIDWLICRRAPAGAGL